MERLRVKNGDFTLLESDTGYHIHKVGDKCKRISAAQVNKKLRELYFKCEEEKVCLTCKHDLNGCDRKMRAHCLKNDRFIWEAKRCSNLKPGVLLKIAFLRQRGLEMDSGPIQSLIRSDLEQNLRSQSNCLQKTTPQKTIESKKAKKTLDEIVYEPGLGVFEERFK